MLDGNLVSSERYLISRLDPMVFLLTISVSALGIIQF